MYAPPVKIDRVDQTAIFHTIFHEKNAEFARI